MSGAEVEQAVAAVLAEALHRATCAEPWDACCWSMEDPDLTDCHDEPGAWREVGLEETLLTALAPLLAAERARALDVAAEVVRALIEAHGHQANEPCDLAPALFAVTQRADREREATT